MVSVVLLFLIAVSSYYFYQRATYYGSRVASFMESKADCRLPSATSCGCRSGFLTHQASAGLARRIDQCDQVAPIVHAVSQQISAIPVLRQH